MKRALLFATVAACGRPVEHRAPAPVVPADAHLVDAAIEPATAAPADDGGDAGVVTTVIRADVVGADTLLILAAGRDQGVQPSWRVTFIVDRSGEIPPCPIARVDRHETACRWKATFLPSRVVRIEP